MHPFTVLEFLLGDLNLFKGCDIGLLRFRVLGVLGFGVRDLVFRSYASRVECLFGLGFRVWGSGNRSNHNRVGSTVQIVVVEGGWGSLKGLEFRAFGV